MADAKSTVAPPEQEAGRQAGRPRTRLSLLWPDRLTGRLGVIFAGALLARLVFLALMWLATDPAAFATPVCRWDCGWYMGIVKGGYDLTPHAGASGAEANWAFFPLYPMLVRLADAILPWGPVAAGTMVSMLTYAATAPVIYAGYRGQIGAESALFAAVAFALSPFGLYGTVPYTEGLFGFLLAACLAAAVNRRWLLAGLAAAFLSATRITGVLIVLPLMILALQQFSWRAFFYRIDAMTAVLALALAPMGAFLFMTFLYHHVGDAFAFRHVQIAWDRGMGNPLAILWDGLQRSVSSKEFYWSLCAFVGLAAAGLLFWRRRFAEGVWQLISVLLPLSTGLFSLGRYSFTTFSPYLALALMPGLARSRLARAAIIVALLAGWYFVIMGWTEQAAWTI